MVAQEDEDEEEDDEAAGDVDDEEGMDTVHAPYQLGHCGASMSKNYLEKGMVSTVCTCTYVHNRIVDSNVPSPWFIMFCTCM